MFKNLFFLPITLVHLSLLGLFFQCFIGASISDSPESLSSRSSSVLAEQNLSTLVPSALGMQIYSSCSNGNSWETFGNSFFATIFSKSILDHPLGGYSKNLSRQTLLIAKELFMIYSVLRI
jgi:hypothetical protein